jgi:hypothetical protein
MVLAANAQMLHCSTSHCSPYHNACKHQQPPPDKVI